MYDSHIVMPISLVGQESHAPRIKLVPIQGFINNNMHLTTVFNHLLPTHRHALRRLVTKIVISDHLIKYCSDNLVIRVSELVDVLHVVEACLPSADENLQPRLKRPLIITRPDIVGEGVDAWVGALEPLLHLEDLILEIGRFGAEIDGEIGVDGGDA